MWTEEGRDRCGLRCARRAACGAWRAARGARTPRRCVELPHAGAHEQKHTSAPDHVHAHARAWTRRWCTHSHVHPHPHSSKRTRTRALRAAGRRRRRRRRWIGTRPAVATARTCVRLSSRVCGCIMIVVTALSGSSPPALRRPRSPQRCGRGPVAASESESVAESAAAAGCRPGGTIREAGPALRLPGVLSEAAGTRQSFIGKIRIS